MGLVIVAFLGLVLGDGIFVWWLVSDYRGLGAMLSDRLALSFMVDAALTLTILCVHFARQPPGRVHWSWFLVLSLVGGLCFGLPFYWWLSKRTGAIAKAT